MRDFSCEIRTFVFYVINVHIWKLFEQLFDRNLFPNSENRRYIAYLFNIDRKLNVIRLSWYFIYENHNWDFLCRSFVRSSKIQRFMVTSIILWTWPSSYNYAVSCAQLLQRSTLRVVNFRPCTTVSLTHGNIIRDRDNFRRNNEIAPLFKDTKTNKLTSLIISNDITINAVTVITLHWNLQRKDNTQNFEILFTILRE